jgi:hypothetical protein
MTHVFLIHGIGLPSKDQFGSKLTQKLHERGITNHKIIPVDWHKLVLLPYIDLETVKKPFRILNLNQISGLMRGLAGCRSPWTSGLPGLPIRLCRAALRDDPRSIHHAMERHTSRRTDLLINQWRRTIAFATHRSVECTVI